MLPRDSIRIAASFMLALMSLASAPASAQQLQRSVLLLDQGSANYHLAQAMVSAFQSAMNAESESSVSIIVESLNLAVFGSAHHLNLRHDYFREKYRGRSIGVIVARGTTVLPHALRLRDELWPGTPLVFADVTVGSIAEFKLPANVTGVTHNRRLQDTLDVARMLVPNLGKIAIVGDSFNLRVRRYAQDLPAVAATIEVIDLTDLPLSEIKRRVATLPGNAAIAYINFTVDVTGVTYIGREVLQSLAEVANRPIVIDVETNMGVGAIGGRVLSADATGRAAARLTWRILNGESPSSIPVVEHEATKLVFDWRQLQRWGISAARLPAGSEIRFRPPTAWEQYQWQIILIVVALVIQTILIFGLLYQHRRRRTAEATSSNAIGKLTHMNRVSTAGELSASIAHEVNQPLAAIVANANAGLRFLAGATPDLDEVRMALKSVVSDGHRAGKVVGSIRAIFKKDNEDKAPVELNGLIQEVLGLVRGELQAEGISVQAGLSRPLPLVHGHGGQLQQVILNLIKNAADAMNSVSGRPRVLRVKSAIHDHDSVLVSVEDSGTGIDPQDIDRIFDSFFTTKSQGMGMGLSICRTIIEAHNGRLWATSGSGRGAVFNVQLPAYSPGGEL
jgi:signal transduction histidine kinase